MAPKKKEETLEEAIKKIHERYGNDPDKLAEAYTELQTKLTSQGDELGTLRKQAEEAQKQLQQYEGVFNQVSPVLDWWKNPETQKQLQQYNAYVTAVQQGNLQQPGQQPSSPQGHQGGSGIGILQPDEVNGLYDQLGKRWQEEVLRPALEQNNQQWKQNAEDMMKQVLAQQEQKFKTWSDVTWKLQEHTEDPEKLEKMKTLQAAALKYADPKQYDPLKTATEFIDLEKKRTDLEAELKKLQEEKEERDKQGLGLLGGSPTPSPSFFEDMESKPVTRGERFAAAHKDTVDAVGTQQFQQDFTGAP